MRARRKAGLTQQDLAGKLGVTQALIRYYERDAKDPKSAFIMKCAAALNVNPEILLRDAHPSKRLRGIRGTWEAILDRATTSLSPRGVHIFFQMVQSDLEVMERTRRVKPRKHA